MPWARKRWIKAICAWLAAVLGTLAGQTAVLADDVAALAAGLTNRTTAIEARRSQLENLLKTEAGANAVLQLAEADTLPVDLRLPATMSLNTVSWPAVREKAAQWLPMPLTQNSVPLPQISELVKLTANAANGAAVFAKPDINCINCHLVQGKGVEIGPDLSGVGDRLKKEEMFENILEPNAVITQGYEAWQATLNDDDEAVGLLIKETPTEVTLKDLKGKVTTYKRADLKKFQRLNVSIMPLGLQQGMTPQDLVDVVGYLSTLHTNKVK